MTMDRSLYACGASSLTRWSVSHTMPCIALVKFSCKGSEVAIDCDSGSVMVVQHAAEDKTSLYARSASSLARPFVPQKMPCFALVNFSCKGPGVSLSQPSVEKTMFPRASRQQASCRLGDVRYEWQSIFMLPPTARHQSLCLLHNCSFETPFHQSPQSSTCKSMHTLAAQAGN